MLVPVIMAGGSGTRLWPLSRELHPKQFLPLCGEETLLQQTISRLQGLDVGALIVITNEEHRFLMAEQLRQLAIKDAQILLEPVGRNTAPAIALAALQAKTREEDPILLVLAADHFIANTAAFVSAVEVGQKLAEQNKLVTFGIVPTQPETGYGYIRRGEELQIGGFSVTKFEEKPDLATAQNYLASKDYFWNSGIFMFKASRYLQVLREFAPEILVACEQAIEGIQTDLDFVRIDAKAFSACPSESIDYAIMEKVQDAVMVPLDAGWSDIGSWSALWENATKDVLGNACKGDVLIEQTTNSLAYSEHRLVTLLGVNNVVVVETKDAVLVASKDSVQDVKKLVEKIQQLGRTEHINHREVYRPWGFYDLIDVGERYQVKRITVNPGAKLSLQMHHHRAEHWVVVSGTAKVTLGDNKQLVTENQSVYIPVGKQHSLENPGKIPLEIIEVQSGAYLGEDDIVRLQDDYGRN